MLGVFHNLQVGSCIAEVTQFVDCGWCVFEQPLSEFRIAPGPGDHTSATFGTNLLGVSLYPGIDGFRIDQSLVNQQCLQCLDSQCWF